MLEACFNLKRHYMNGDDLKAGYYMLWLIKQTSGCSFKIPSKETFNETTVKTVLSGFISSDDFTLKYPDKFIELLINIYVDFLEDDCHEKFIKFILTQLQSTTRAAWPRKDILIRGLLEGFNASGKTALANALASSSDPQTAKIGHHISHALKSATLRAALRHFYALTELLPDFKQKAVETIFGRPFEPFRREDTRNTDPEFTRRLKFTQYCNAFVQNNLMIGVCSYRKMPPLLLAYDMQTEKNGMGSYCNI